MPPPDSTARTHTPSPDRVHFKVKLDRLGHMLIECVRGAERTETGLRGIPMLVANGFLLKPESYHVDPMQRAIEVDGVRFDCTEAGARHLEEAFNARYSPRLGGDRAISIEFRENLAATTGFDIHFTVIRAGVPFEIKGHLSQENLDILQDPVKCDLLQPGI